MSLLTDYFAGGGSLIKSVQRGVLSAGVNQITTAVAITSVTLAKSKLNFLGCSMASQVGLAGDIAYIALTSPTAITLTRGDGSYSASVSWEVIEWL